jgi:DNA repair protein RadD
MQLRAYQHEALAALWRFWRAGGGNPLVALATGTGKSLLIADLCRRFALRDRRIVVLSHVREIIEQDFKALATLWPEAPLGAVGINCAALGERNTEAPIVLATVHSIFRDPQALGRRELVLIDEAQLVPHGDDGMYRTTITALDGPHMRVAGFSATPFRLDSGRLDQGDRALFDAVVYRYGIHEGVRDGFLAPLVAKGSKAAEIDTRGVARRGGEFVAGELETAADTGPLVTGAVSEILHHAQGRNGWLVFCCGIAHAFHVRDVLRARGILCATIAGDAAASERAGIIADFRAGRITALTGCNVFTTGFDVPHVDLIAMLRPTLSPGLYVQMAGRGTRIAASKQNCLLLDFGGNVMRHGPVDEVTGVFKTRRGPGAAPMKQCPDCDSLVPAGALACPDCGYQWPVRVPKHATSASTLAPLGGSPKWIPVHGVLATAHDKPGKPSSLRIDYVTQEGFISDWLAFEHGNGARWHAAQKWRALGGRDPIPTTTQQALARRGEFSATATIAVRRDGKYWRVIGHRLRPNMMVVS